MGDFTLTSQQVLFPLSVCTFPTDGQVCDGAGSSSAGASYNLDDSRARTYCACSRCGGGLFGILLSSILSPSLWETARYIRKYCLKGPLNLKYFPLMFQCSAMGE